eukprot:12230090-Alexandrium_andersonii.AAC.1
MSAPNAWAEMPQRSFIPLLRATAAVFQIALRPHGRIANSCEEGGRISSSHLSGSSNGLPQDLSLIHI